MCHSASQKYDQCVASEECAPCTQITGAQNVMHSTGQVKMPSGPSRKNQCFPLQLVHFSAGLSLFVGEAVASSLSTPF